MKLKKLMSAVVATAMAVTAMASMSIFSASAEGNIALTFVVDDETSTQTDYGAWGGPWMQCYDSALAGAETATVEVAFSVPDAASKWEGFELCKFYGGTITNSEWMLGSTSQIEYVVSCDVPVNEYNGIGFNFQAGQAAISITSAEITKIDGVPLEADTILPNTVYVQKTAVVDGKYSERAIKMITEEEAQAASKVSVVFNNGTKNSAPVVSTQYYKTITVAGEPITADDGYVFVAAVVKNIPESIDLTATITVE